MKYKGQLAKIGSIHTADIKQGNRIGAVCFLRSVAEKINLIEALGNGRQGRLALWQIFSHLIDRGSRLSAIQLARKHSAYDLLELKPFDEDQLHENLSWLFEKQASIEKNLFPLGLGNNFSQVLISIMLSYLLEREIEKYWHPIDLPFDEGINELSSIRTVEITFAGTIYRKVPTPTGLCKELLDAANVKLPLMIPMKAHLSNLEQNDE